MKLYKTMPNHFDKTANDKKNSSTSVRTCTLILTFCPFDMLLTVSCFICYADTKNSTFKREEGTPKAEKNCFWHCLYLDFVSSCL